MADAQSRTLAPLLILRILEEFSDEKHPLTREDIEQILDERYAITMERKAFFRHIKHLNELDDVDIRRVKVKSNEPDKSVCAGFYLTDRAFSEMELRVIIDALSGSRYLSQWETEDLLARLSSLSNRYFQKRMSSYQLVGSGGKTKNETLMINLEIIDEAIAEHKQIRFDLFCTGKNGEKELASWCKESCTPVRYFVKDHSYYLVGLLHSSDKLHIVSYTLADMVNVEKLDKPADDIHDIAEFKHGIDWKKFLREHPALDNLRGKPELCTFHCRRWMLDEIKSHFGDDLRVRQLVLKKKPPASFGIAPDGLLEVSVITDPYAAMMFAWQHPEGLWLVAPDRANQALRWRLEKQVSYYAYWEECNKT